jgi:Zn-dependent metalloprotease
MDYPGTFPATPPITVHRIARTGASRAREEEYPLKLSPRVVVVAGALAAGLATAGTAAAVQAAPSTPSGSPNTPEAARALAAKSVAAVVANRPSYLHASADDQFIQHEVVSSGSTQYVPYDRTYKGLRVVGGDFVMVTDASGQTRYASVAQQQSIGNLATTPKLSRADAEAVARTKVPTVTGIESTQLVVYALTGTPRLAWESTVLGTNAEGPSRLSVDVDAISGAVLNTQEHVMYGDGSAAWNGPNPVHINTSGSGSSFSMTDPTVRNLSCQDNSTRQTFTGPDDKWGNGDATSKETGCVDALFVAQTEVKMLSTWLGRNAMDGSGGAWPIRVGLNQQNAFYDGTQVAVGKNTKNQWISSLDVVGHEMGHGVDDHTPGGISGSGTQEFVADTFGAMTEWFANEPAPFDKPDFTVGETINLVGSGPIRFMYNPSLAGHANCYSSSIPGTEVHAAAGPGNHWFYLVAEGNAPTDGQPTSPTCNGKSVTGLGIQKAAKIMYNAMLMKTSGSSYLKYRTWTLQAAKNLFPNSCAEFDTVKAAWDAVSVPAQSGDPTCTGGGPSPTASPTGPPGGNCSGQQLGNPGFESGVSVWSASAGVIAQRGSAQPAHGGTWTALLGGHGTTRTDTLSQSVAVPAGCHATLSFWLHIDTRETTTRTQYDKLTVRVGSQTVATFSNLNAAAGYAQKSFDVSGSAGQTVAVTFTGTEDVSLQTSFVIDDTALTLS